jgi:hypothetical protein
MVHWADAKKERSAHYALRSYEPVNLLANNILGEFIPSKKYISLFENQMTGTIA